MIRIQVHFNLSILFILAVAAVALAVPVPANPGTAYEGLGKNLQDGSNLVPYPPHSTLSKDGFMVMYRRTDVPETPNANDPDSEFTFHINRAPSPISAPPSPKDTNLLTDGKPKKRRRLGSRGKRRKKGESSSSDPQLKADIRSGKKQRSSSSGSQVGKHSVVPEAPRLADLQKAKSLAMPQRNASGSQSLQPKSDAKHTSTDSETALQRSNIEQELQHTKEAKAAAGLKPEIKNHKN